MVYEIIKAIMLYINEKLKFNKILNSKRCILTIFANFCKHILFSSAENMKILIRIL